MKKYYVTMTDRFLSGWGRAEGRKNKVVIECNSLEEARKAEEWAKKRPEMKYVSIRTTPPYYPSNSVLTTHRKYKDFFDFGE